MSSVELYLLRQRIAETSAWSSRHASLLDPERSLRTPALRPSNRAESAGPYGYFEYEWESSSGKSPAVHAVSVLAEKRAALLEADGAVGEAHPEGLPQGRLLIIDPLNSDSSGLSEPDSRGFLDVFDVPAWDTWVAFLDEPRCTTEDDPATCRRYAGGISVSYLLCWIPAAYVSLVQDGIAVNPTDCIFWSVDYLRRGFDTPTMRWLDSQGLLW